MAGRHRSCRVPAEGRRQLDDLFELLTDSRRRQVLYLLRTDETCQLTVLAQEIASREAGTSLERVPEDRVRAVYLDLYHTHVPKLSDSEVVRYSDQLGEVELCRTDEAFRRCLDAAARLEGVPVES